MPARELLYSSLRQFRGFASQGAQPWPTQVKLLKHEKALEVSFTDGQSFRLPAELLRVISPAANSAKPQRLGQDVKVVAGRRHVGIMQLEQVGNYAIRVHFDDLHAHGLFTWELLHDLGTNKISHIRRYLKALKAQGLSRDPRTASRGST